LFPADSAKLTPGAQATLDRLGRALVSPVLAGYRFRIEGHSDASSTAERALDLSTRRAESIRDYLVAAFALDPAIFDTVGLGASVPFVVPSQGVPEPLNRRAQLLNLGR
jgi:outer membrane protein OmpA-like peptidoglycan-associated protein